MAVTPTVDLKIDDQFLLNRGTLTFKTGFKNLADNVLYLALDGENGGLNSLILINDLKDVDVNKYISARNPATGEPTLVSTLASGTETINSKNWLLQHVPKTITGATADEWVLADPAAIFAELTGDIGEAFSKLELNALNDVTTREGADNNTTDKFLPTEAGDSFLLCSKAGTWSQAPDGTVTQTLPEYTVKSLKEKIQDNITNGNVIIDLGHLDDVDKNDLGRLEINTGKVAVAPDISEPAWYPGAVGIPKYRVTNDPAPKFDDILVHITDPSVEVADAGAADSVPGWFYAEAQFGDELSPAGLDSSADLPNIGESVNLGGVRVLQYMNTVLEPDGSGGKKIKELATTPIPSNIGITSEGVLYSQIPNTLSFRSVIVINDVDGVETFNELLETGGELVTVADPANGVDGGPGQYLTPGNPDTDPEVGDFYVVTFEAPTAGTSTLTSKTLAWRDSTTTNGSAPIVENGDIVAWSGSRWAVIGTVNTDTIAQDLQSVTGRGRTTSESILVNLSRTASPSISGIGDGLIYVEGLTLVGDAQAPTPTAGDVIAKRLCVSNIDFASIPTLTN